MGLTENCELITDNYSGGQNLFRHAAIAIAAANPVTHRNPYQYSERGNNPSLNAQRFARFTKSICESDEFEESCEIYESSPCFLVTVTYLLKAILANP